MNRRYFLKGSLFAGIASVFGIRIKPSESITFWKGQTLEATTIIDQSLYVNAAYEQFMDKIINDICEAQQIPRELLTQNIIDSYSLSKENAFRRVL